MYTTPTASASLMASVKTVMDPRASSVVRISGTQVLLVGWFYVVAARARSPQMIAATIIGHGFVLPLLLILIGFMGNIDFGMPATFAMTDFLLGNLAWYIYSQDMSSKIKA